MILYVESNFVLELVLEQEELADAETLFAAAETGAVKLAIPSFSIAEPFSTVAQRSRRRKQLNTQIADEARQLDRAAPHSGLADEARSVAGKLAALDAHESSRLEATVTRLLAIADVIPLTQSVYGSALSYARTIGLAPSDAVVLGSVMDDLGRRSPTEPKLFVTRNPKDFDDPEVHRALAAHQCALASSFGAGRQALPAPPAKPS